MDNETCTVELPSGPTSFRSTVVKPYLPPLETPVDPAEPQAPAEPTAEPTTDPREPSTPGSELPSIEVEVPQADPSRKRSRPRKHAATTYAADITIYL